MNEHLLDLGTPVVPSRICMGGADFGTKVSRDDSFALLDHYLELGGNVIDTAHLYARSRPNGEGASERTIGEWLRLRGCRDRVVLITKGGHRTRVPYSEGRLSRESVEGHLTLSLERLGVDHVDLFFLHHDEPSRPIEQIIDTVAALYNRGLFRRYGLSNWTTDRLEAAVTYAREAGLPTLSTTQTGYSLCTVPDYLADKNAGNRMIFMGDAQWAWQSKHHLPCLAYSSQARGYFGAANAAWAADGFNGSPPCDVDYDSPVNRARLAATVRAAEQLGVTTNQVALAWLMHQPFAVYPIVATSQPARLEEAMASVKIDAPAVMAALASEAQSQQ